LKILLDENMPHQLRGHLPNHDVYTAVYVGFGGFTNGELLQAAEVAGFGARLGAKRKKARGHPHPRFQADHLR
jgi:hypothetical protein